MIDEDKLRRGDDFIKKAATDLSWMFSKDIYEAANDDVFVRYQKDKDSHEFLSMQTFLDNINRGYIKNKKDAQEEFKTVKRNVKSEALKKIVKELQFGIFGPDDDADDKDDGDDGHDKDDRDDKDDGEWDGYEESIGERVKLKNQDKISDRDGGDDKISEKEFKEKYATGYKLDDIAKKLLGKTYNPEPGKETTFGGFKEIIDDYENGLTNYDALVKFYKNLGKSVKLNNQYYENNNLVYNRIDKITDMIKLYEQIRYNKKAIIKSIKNRNQELYNKTYYTIDSTNNIISSNYDSRLKKFASYLDKDSSLIDIEKIDAILNKLNHAINNFDSCKYKDD